MRSAKPNGNHVTVLTCASLPGSEMFIETEAELIDQRP